MAHGIPYRMKLGAGMVELLVTSDPVPERQTRRSGGCLESENRKYPVILFGNWRKQVQSAKRGGKTDEILIFAAKSILKPLIAVLTILST